MSLAEEVSRSACTLHHTTLALKDLLREEQERQGWGLTWRAEDGLLTRPQVAMRYGKLHTCAVKWGLKS